ncbi:MAG: hypothetical protein GWN84_25360 [Gammaproteobacteria bacterium]|nr:hypothetical protein [Gammaproteobacteria bacterium]NIR90633.1 hypothetical protein [Gammaproteobacteria bacterium]NIU07013.1 hypothetical protein [Gammaproteobacteria bacterium]NIV53923.1 hypothetical protein [Gammaproteobacteria bacterium]NIW86154.1 hypothetical protein [Gammaproteobacteria bacterium]
MTVRDPLQSLHHGIDAFAARAAHGAAPEGREAGAEHHAGVEQIGVGDWPFTQAGHRLVEQAQNEPVLDGAGIRRAGAAAPGPLSALEPRALQTHGVPGLLPIAHIRISRKR